jgi:hypothetical protein
MVREFIVLYVVVVTIIAVVAINPAVDTIRRVTEILANR